MRKPRQSKGKAVKDTLAGFPLFEGVKARTVDELAKSASEVMVPRRSTIYAPWRRMHRPPSHRHRARQAGTAAARRRRESGCTDLCRKLVRRNSASAEAAASGRRGRGSHSTLLHLPAQAVLDCLTDDRVFAVHLLTETCRRLRDDAEMSAARRTFSARDRVISFLVDVLPTATYNGGTAKIMLPAAKHVIASRLNLTPAHLSRVLAELRRDRIIGVEGQCVVVPDVRRLQASQNRDAQSPDAR